LLSREQFADCQSAIQQTASLRYGKGKVDATWKTEVIFISHFGDSAKQRVKAILEKIFGSLTGWIGDGPWRSKSVMAALAAVVAGTGFWVSDLKKGPPQNEAGIAAATNASGIMLTNATGMTLTNTAGAPAQTHRSWGKPFPLYAKVAASYVVGFCIGWFVRKLIRLIVIIVALVVAVVALGRFAGCDTTRTQEQIQHGGEWAQQELTTAQDRLMKMLPSAAGSGVGAFWGFRRRGKVSAPKPAG
jgi:uncharacterized membrane protein (Fun14 family)